MMSCLCPFPRAETVAGAPAATRPQRPGRRAFCVSVEVELLAEAAARFSRIRGIVQIGRALDSPQVIAHILAGLLAVAAPDGEEDLLMEVMRHLADLLELGGYLPDLFDQFVDAGHDRGDDRVAAGLVNELVDLGVDLCAVRCRLHCLC